MINIAIDGPSGAGKSVISKALAKELGYVYLDTGALYRTIGLFAHRKLNEKSDDRAAVVDLLGEIDINIKFMDEQQHVFLNGEDVSEAIRMPEISMAASNVSAFPEVRSFLLELQRKMARENNCVMDGRDIGTVVLPKAQVKIFLTASSESRAERRYAELKEKGIDIEYNTVLEELKLRDNNDMNRQTAPLKPAADSLIIDTTGNSLQQSLDVVIKTAKEKIKDEGF